MGLSIAKLVIKAESDSRSSLETSSVSKEGSNFKASITTNDSKSEIPRATNTSSDREAHTERQLLKVGESKQISIAQRIPQGEQVLVHPINVGQGDAILLEIQSQNGQSEKHLTDGGQGQRTQNTQYYQNLKDTLRARGCLVQKNRTEIGNTLEDRICEQVTMDSIVITHPNLDHYGGINRLLQDFTITAPITTTLASCLKVGHSGGPKDTQLGEVFLSSERCRVRHWFPLTGEGNNGRRHTNIKTLPMGSTIEIEKNEEVRFKEKKLEKTSSRKKKLTNKQRKAKWLKKFNATSILTTVKLQESTCKYDYDVVLTGDSYGTIIEKKLALKGKSVGVFQVPHHGSSYNLDDEKTIRSTAEEFTDFYSSFNAYIYLISHGNGYKHPHSEVITGILSAAVQKKRDPKCMIVVTATWFKKSKIDETNISNWRDYVNIYYFKPDTPDVAPYVTLDPNNKQLPEGLQLFVKKVPAPKSLEDKLGGENLQRREIGRDGNSFFNAVSGALTNKNTPIQLREMLVEHLMGLQGLYYPRSGATTMEEYNEIVSKYLLDGHFSSDIEKILPEAMGRTLNIRIQVIAANPEQEDKFYGVESTQTILKLIYNETDNGHYDYAQQATAPRAGRLLKHGPSCRICNEPENPKDKWYKCTNRRCPIKIHTSCEEKTRKHRYKKCEYCRTCKECTKKMQKPRHDSFCQVCGGAGMPGCIEKCGQAKGEYTCKKCRE